MEVISVERYREMMKAKPHQKKKSGKGSKAKGEILLMLQLVGIPFEQEYKFHPERKWRFDFAIPSKKIAIEYEGLMSDKSRHTTVQGFSNDSEKYNQAQLLGWKVLRYTALTYTKLASDLRTDINTKL